MQLPQQRRPTFVLVALAVLGFAAVFALADTSFDLVRENEGVSPIQNSYLVQRSTAYTDQDQQCGGVPSPKMLTKFSLAPEIVSVTVCEQGFPETVIVANDLNTVKMQDFANTLAYPDAKAQLNIACTEEYLMLPSFVIELPTGQRLYPAAPLDVCMKPQPEFLAAFDALRGLMRD